MTRRISRLFVLAVCAAASVAGAEPRRVATLLPFVGEALTRFPAHATLVATVRRTPAEPAPAAAIDLGTPHAPNLELLAAARAELVVADASRHAAIAGKLAVGGAEVLLVDADSVDATLAALATVGERIGAGAEMAAEVGRVRAEIAAIAAAGGRSERVLPVFGAPGSYLLATGRTWWGDLLAKLGRASILPDGLAERMPGYVQLSDEVLAATRVDRVVLLAHGDPPAVARAFAADLDRLGRGDLPVQALDPALFATNPGLRLPEAARVLAGGAGGGPS